MKILHIVAGVPPGGGIAESVPELCRYLHLQGHEVTLATLDGPQSEAAVRAGEVGVSVVRFKPSFPRSLYFSWSMLRGLAVLVHRADVVHVHSNWTFPVWWGCSCALRTGRPLVISPRGCLSPVRLRRSAWKKRAAGFLFDRRYLRAASLIHATCEAERQEIMTYIQGGLAVVPTIKVVPNGIEVEVWRGNCDCATVDMHWPACRGRRLVLFLGRIDPVKGLDLLVGAWLSITREHPDWHLLVLGPDEAGYASHVRSEIRNAGLAAVVTLDGPVYGQEKHAVMRAADLFVLPTYNENFGITVAEALAASVPVITTKGAPWAELLGQQAGLAERQNSGVAEWQDSGVAEWQNSREEGRGKSTPIISPAIRASLVTPATPATQTAPAIPAISVKQATPAIAANGRCGWWVDVGVEPLTEALHEALNLTDEERHAMGENGRRLVEAKYQWETVAAKMAEVYSGVAE